MPVPGAARVRQKKRRLDAGYMSSVTSRPMNAQTAAALRGIGTSTALIRSPQSLRQRRMRRLALCAKGFRALGKAKRRRSECGQLSRFLGRPVGGRPPEVLLG